MQTQIKIVKFWVGLGASHTHHTFLFDHHPYNNNQQQQTIYCGLVLPFTHCNHTHQHLEQLANREGLQLQPHFQFPHQVPLQVGCWRHPVPSSKQHEPKLLDHTQLFCTARVFKDMRVMAAI